jgi:hypothetical protein
MVPGILMLWLDPHGTVAESRFDRRAERQIIISAWIDRVVLVVETPGQSVCR